MTTQFDCPDNHGKPHSFDSIGLCRFFLLYDPSQDKQVRQSEKVILGEVSSGITSGDSFTMFGEERKP